MRVDSAEGRATSQEVAGTLGGGSGSRGWNSGHWTTFIPVDVDASRVNGCLTTTYGSKNYSNGAHARWAQGQAIAFSAKDYGGDAGPLSPTLRSGTHDASHANGGVMPAVALSTVVRRLTPRECERLQGLPDDWTLVPYRGKPAADAPRYKAIGNGMAMPVLRWIGQRIAMVEGERRAWRR